MTDKQVRSDEARRNLRDLLDEVALGARVTILRYDKPAARLVPVLTDADRALAARARALAAAPPDGDAAALGRAKVLLGELADRLDGDTGSTP
jgi:antitoxin (DNA-binding transcriptional repressor) of toxin-antitoxin stability system